MTDKLAEPRSRRTLLVLALLASVLLPACRCDGGFGRKSNSKSWDWTWQHLGDRARADNVAFSEHLANLPGFLTPDFNAAAREISKTTNLYTTGQAEPCWCPEAR